MLVYAIDSLSEAAGIELNDNTAYTAWWRSRIRPFLEAGIMVVATHLSGHVKPGVGRTRESVVRNATRIRALSSHVLDLRQLGETTFKVVHNKHRNSTGLPFGVLELAGAEADPWIELRLNTGSPISAASKMALARAGLLKLGAQRPAAWLTKKDIEGVLNNLQLDKKERISARSWEPALAELVEGKRFE